MQPSLLYRRNRLSFPAGSAPGFDPTHPAAKGLVGPHGLSAVFSGGGFVSLATGAAGTLVPGVSGAVACHQNNGFGFKVTAGAAGQYCQFTGTTIQDLVATVAIIGTYEAGSGGVYFHTDTANTGGFRFEDNGLTMPFAAAVPSGLGVPPIAPIFYAASKTATAVNFVQVNLATGKLRTAIVANSSTPVVPGAATQCIFSKTSSNAAGGSVAAAMWAPVALSLSQLVQWSTDPWAFWYPRAVPDRAPAPFFPSAPAPGRIFYPLYFPSN